MSNNYKLEKATKGLTLNQIILCLHKMAYFHAISYGYSQTNSIDFTKFPISYEKYVLDKKMVDVFHSSVKLMKEDFLQIAIDKDIIENALDNFDKKELLSLHKYVNLSSAHFISHGDFWSNNVMFCSNNDKGMNKQKLV